MTLGTRKPRPRPYCPCGCGNRGLCDPHRARLARFRQEMTQRKFNATFRRQVRNLPLENDDGHDTETA